MEPWLDPQHQIKRAVMVHVCICAEAGGTDVQGHVRLHETLFQGTKTYPYEFKVKVVKSSLSPVATYLYNSLYVSKDPTGGTGTIKCHCPHFGGMWGTRPVLLAPGAGFTAGLSPLTPFVVPLRQRFSV